MSDVKVLSIEAQVWQDLSLLYEDQEVALVFHPKSSAFFRFPASQKQYLNEQTLEWMEDYLPNGLNQPYYITIEESGKCYSTMVL